MLILLIAAALHVDADAGNNKFDATFDAPLGERIMAVSSAVGCDLTLENGVANGTCSVPLSSITVDSEPTKTEHFQQWATNKKSDPKDCKLEAQVKDLKVEIGKPFAGDVPFTVCGRARSDGKPEKLTGTSMTLPDGRIRIRARVERFDREKYRIGPKFTEGWLSRVQQLAPVVAAVGSIDISVFAVSANPKEARK